jgi:acetyl-CoA decarbonylase/synthase complex subunit gamma
VSAHQVKRLTGFRVIYGPIKARDLPAFLDAGMEASPRMRRREFPLAERVVLIPVELVSALKTAALVIPAVIVLSGLGGPAGFWSNAWVYGSFAALALLAAVFSGTVLTPVLLPWLPGRAFSVKGLAPALLMFVLVVRSSEPSGAAWPDGLSSLSWLLLMGTVSSFLAMNFTGASTYTSLSGVQREMRWAVPIQICAAALGLGLWLCSRLMA